VVSAQALVRESAQVSVLELVPVSAQVSVLELVPASVQARVLELVFEARTHHDTFHMHSVSLTEWQSHIW